MNALAQQNPVALTAASVPIESKRELAKANTRRALLKSALQLYSLEGACGMSMNKVAKGAGIAQPSFYNHFDSMDALQNELSAQLKVNYLSPMRVAWVNMIKDYDSLNKEQFSQRCQQCLTMIFDAAFQNIALFQHLIEDRPRYGVKPEKSVNKDLENRGLVNNSLDNKKLGNLITEIQEEWTDIFIQGLQLSNRCFERTEVNLCVDIASAQVHELILGCHQERYSRQQAITILSTNFNALFIHFFARK